MAHLGGHGLWPVGPVIGVVLPPLWHRGHKGCRYVAASEAGDDLDHEAGEGPRRLCNLPAANRITKASPYFRQKAAGLVSAAAGRFRQAGQYSVAGGPPRREFAVWRSN